MLRGLLRPLLGSGRLLQTGRRLPIGDEAGLRFVVIALLALPLTLFVLHQALAGTRGPLGMLTVGLVAAYPIAAVLRYLLLDRQSRESLAQLALAQVIWAMVATSLLAIWFWGNQHFELALPSAHLPPLVVAVVFVALLYPITLLSVTWRQDVDHTTWADWLLALIALICGCWLIGQTGRYSEWISGIDEFELSDQIVAATYLLLTLELLRRCVGTGLSLVVYLLLGYLFAGHLLDGTFAHRPFTMIEFLEEMIISHSGGLFGIPLQVAASYAFLFILFGKLLEASGGGQFFFDMASAIAGRREGGVAKVAVVSSGLFGTLSGSPAADVMTTGSITIPMMKRLGYGGLFAAAVESVASTGGSLLPPVMGAAVFLMVEFSATPYADIALAAAGVGLCYYLSVYLQVHWRSRRLGFTGVDPSALPSVTSAFRNGWFHLLPLTVLITLLVLGYSPALVAAGAVLVVLVTSHFGDQPISPRRLVTIVTETCAALAPLVAAVAAAGVVIGCLNITGLAGKLATLIFTVTGGSVLGSLIVAMVITVILGMGMPVVAAYSVVATLIAPVLVNLGLPVLQSHLFLVYFSVLSAITPPVAIACFVAASIADENPMAVARQSIKLALVAFLLPYLFVYQPALLFQGSWIEITVAGASVLAGIWLLTLALEGYYRAPVGSLYRLLLVLVALTAFAPSMWSSVLALALFPIIVALLNRSSGADRPSTWR